MAHWVLEVLKHLKFKNQSVIGHSMGSLIALEYAGPSRCRAHRADRHCFIPCRCPEAFLEAAQRISTPLRHGHHLGHAPQCRWAAIRPGMWMWRHAGAPAPARPRRPLHDLKACNDYSGGSKRREGAVSGAIRPLAAATS